MTLLDPLPLEPAPDVVFNARGAGLPLANEVPHVLPVETLQAWNGPCHASGGLPRVDCSLVEIVD